MNPPFKHIFAFLTQFIKTPLRVGSAIPSSHWLAERVSQSIATNNSESAPPKRYLEVGAGTGTLTQKIIQKLRPNDHLDIVEVDDTFCAILHRKFGHIKNVTIHHTSIVNWKSKESYFDAIISALPLSSFSSDQVEAIYRTYESLLKTEGGLSYIEHIGVSVIGKLFLLAKKKKDFRAVQQIKQDFYEKNNGRSEIEWWNFPPIRVCRCTIAKDSSYSEPESRYP
ncbi:MAG: methyltransferase domain-containing protein [Waddliaceae bacterium]